MHPFLAFLFLGGFELFLGSIEDVAKMWVGRGRAYIMYGALALLILTISPPLWYLLLGFVAWWLLSRYLEKHIAVYARGDILALTWMFLGTWVISPTLALLVLLFVFLSTLFVWGVVILYCRAKKIDRPERLPAYPLLLAAWLILAACVL